MRNWLTCSLPAGVALDEPGAVAHHRRIIQGKPFLHRVYEEWYEQIAAAIPAGRKPALEIGSGPGFLAEKVPHLLTSDVVATPGLHVALDATRLPFGAGSLRAIVMTNVLHHIARPRAFFAEAARVVDAGGVVVMLEPWLSRWSRFVYGSLHHEPCEPAAAQWEFPEGGRLSSANSALPWIIFDRDRATFEREFPQWRIDRIGFEPGMPFRYLLSGGLSLRSLTPAATFEAWRSIENRLSRRMAQWAMFALIRLERVSR